MTNTVNISCQRPIFPDLFHDRMVSKSKNKHLLTVLTETHTGQMLLPKPNPTALENTKLTFENSKRQLLKILTVEWHPFQHRRRDSSAV